MISTLLASINVLLLTLISLLHVYWVVGGKWGLDSAMPEKYKENYFKESNKVKMNIATLVVAIGLLLMAIISATEIFDLSDLIGSKWSTIALSLIAAIFILRGIGDFNEFGLFRKVSGSRFSNKDRQIFTPLCLYLGISSILISIY